jgi:hypothetical protein
MTNNKQQTAVEWQYIELAKWFKELSEYKDSKDILDKAKEMEIAGKEMSYDDGYAEGYKRALELVEWYIKNYIGGMVQGYTGDINKKVDE